MDLYLAAKQRPGPRVKMRWWEQEGLDLEGKRTAAREAERTEQEEDTDRTEILTDGSLSEEDTAVNITLGTDHNAPLAYAPRLALHHPIMSNHGEYGGQ